MPLSLEQLEKIATPKQMKDVRRQLAQGATGAPPAAMNVQPKKAPAEKPKGKQRGRKASQSDLDFDTECWPGLAEELGLYGLESNETPEDFNAGTWLELASRCRYKPDRLAKQDVGGEGAVFEFTRRVYIEIKGGLMGRGIHEDSRIKYKFATRMYPDALFIWAQRKKKGEPWRCQVWQDGEQIRTVKV